MEADKRNVCGTSEKIIFDTMVTPVLCYGAKIWGYAYSEQIETV